MKKLLQLFLLYSLISCQTKNEHCCDQSNLIISDVYLVEDEHKSRYICIVGVPGKNIVSTYLSSTQNHAYEYEEHIITVDFQHNIIDDNLTTTDTNTMRILKLDFGILKIGVYSQQDNSKVSSKVKKAIENINVRYFENVEVCYGNSESINVIPNELIDMGATKFEKTNNRKILTIKLQENYQDTIIDLLFDNIDLIYGHLEDKDIINFESMNGSGNIIRSYILTDSKGHDISANEGCGMGPKERRFECVYVNSNTIQ